MRYCCVIHHIEWVILNYFPWGVAFMQILSSNIWIVRPHTLCKFYSKRNLTTMCLVRDIIIDSTKYAQSFVSLFFWLCYTIWLILVNYVSISFSVCFIGFDKCCFCPSVSRVALWQCYIAYIYICKTTPKDISKIGQYKTTIHQDKMQTACTIP